MEKLVERFLTYVKVNTRSDANSQTTPTTVGQVVLAKMIETELHELGLADVHYNEQNGFLTARLPGNQPAAKSIGLIAHLDTADFSAENIRPQVITNYDGQDVLLNQEQGIVLSVAEFPNLKEYQGETLITTDGTTLLGADDKAGIVEILGAVEYFLTHPEVARGMFGSPSVQMKKLDAGPINLMHRTSQSLLRIRSTVAVWGISSMKRLTSSQAVITIEGTSVHPGTAYGSLVNAIKLGEQLDQSLPQKEVPEQTRGNEGFYLLNKFTGSIEKAELVYIIRDHDQENFQARKQFLEKQVQRLNALADKPRLTITFQDQYYNMKEIIEKDWTPVELAVQAMESCDIEPIITPFRGGTDGSKISFMGISTPNLFTGGENFHGQYEFITVESMAKAVQTIIAIIRLNAN